VGVSLSRDLRNYNSLKVNADKTETMVCAKTAESLQITDRRGKALKQVENFRYLGAVIHTQGGSEEGIKARIAAACKKWQELTEVLCDRRMPIALKGKVYRTMIRPVLIYGSEAWTLRRREEGHLERTEMRMLCWILGLTLNDHWSSMHHGQGTRGQAEMVWAYTTERRR